MGNHVIFMIESGKALELVRRHIAEVRRVRNESMALMKELGVERARVSDADGTVIGVDFGKGPRHPDFKVPSKFGSCPKIGTAWAKRFKDQKGYDLASSVIAETFGIPLMIGYSSNASRGSGWRRIGYPLSECGFLFLSEDKGPYAMWVHDVPAEVAADREKGYAIEEPAASFKLEFEGCRRIDQEEWDLIVAQHKLQEKRAKAA